jgi:hypothetical protein
VCPQEEEDWYLQNSMLRYNNGNTESVNSLANALLLRADLHIAFDKPSFVFVPKPANVESQQFVLHLLEPSREFECLYHNRAMQSLGVSMELLFARFAWTILPLLAGFLKGKVQRRLRLSTMINEATGAGMAPFLASVEQCEDLVSKTSKSRNASSKKRDRPDDNVADADTGLLRDEKHQRPRKRHRHSKSPQDLAAIEVKSVSAPSTKDNSPTTPNSFHVAPSHRQEWLNRERLASDPDHLWDEEVAWAADVYKGTVTLGESNAKRWLAFNGEEPVDHGLSNDK